MYYSWYSPNTYLGTSQAVRGRKKIDRAVPILEGLATHKNCSGNKMVFCSPFYALGDAQNALCWVLRVLFFQLQQAVVHAAQTKADVLALPPVEQLPREISQFPGT